MESVKKWLSERRLKKNGLYVHHSPPKLLDVVSAAQLRQWARGGEAGRLERAVLAGQGHRLLAEAEALPIASHLPNLVAKCDALHAAVEKGSLLELQELLEPEYNKRKYVMCCDSAGVGLLHKAIFYDFMDIAAWLVDKYPQLVHLRDSEGRTPLHYSVVCRDEAAAAALLEAAGAARGARDAEGHTPAFYRGPARSRLALPTTGTDMAPDVRNTGLNIKRHNIRIWCHDCDMARLQRVVWEGHGTKLLSEVSNQPAVKRFLEAVPYIMNTIKDMHSCVIENDLEGLMKHAGHPVPPLILSSRDKNNMTVMHKAAGLGHGGILGYIADRYPEGINDVDNEGRTPLHYAAAVKDDQHIYNTLVSLGADESTVDNKNRTPGYYVNRPQEIDKNLFKVLPDAPRTPSSAYPPNWDWQILDTEAVVELNKKPNKKKNLKASNENISSKNMSNSISEKSNSRHKGMKASSTHEYIKGLPDLNGTKSKHTKKITNKDSEDVQDTNEEDNHDEKVDEPNTQDDTESNEIENKETEAHKSENEEDVNNDEHEISGTKIEDKENVEPHDENDEEQEQEEVDKETEEKLGNEDEHHDSEKKEDVTIEPNEEENEDAPETHDSDNAEKEKVIDKEENKIVHEENTKESHVKHESNLDETSHKIHDTTEDNKSSPTKGNNEDDDDVQTQDDSHSEYSDIHLRSTAEAADRRSAKRGNENDDGRNTQDSLIEGIISGDAEQDTQDASIIRDENVEGDILIIDSQIDPEVTELINTSNMEMLAALVLNGEGARLVGRRSGNSELQAFLDNVPTYMQKINKVHLAARDGNIRDLQAALDRRKFAIARDPISPNGATPLHIATVFGKTNIMKYLGGRFPETLSAVDFEGRTALHYAAVIPDNGHYYNMLQQLGANSKDLDDNGRSAEEYLRNPNLLPFSQLISDYGISEEVAQEMLADKGPANSTNGHMDIPNFKTDEGRYLAQSLGDPLIKGLTEVANVKPKDPVAFLASFLHNFPDHEKTQLGTQESNMIVTQPGEVENDQPPPLLPPMTTKMVSVAAAKLPRSATRTATRPHKPIDVVAVDPQQEASPDAPEAAYSSVNRDEHGQSMLHFAAARAHTRNALFQLLQESGISLGYRDELYRTARDVSIQANVLDNTKEIDRWVLHLAARGNTQKIMELLLEGYDHILDVVDEEGVPITDVVAQRGDNEMSSLLASIPTFEESRETLHGAIRRGDLSAVQSSIAAEGGRTLARGQNSYGRTTLHIAVLAQHEDIVAHLAQTCPELLRLGDNLERTPLHYAMGAEKMESLSRILIRAGSKRVLKDLKGRQPSYYFMNKSDILRLKEEEEVY